MKKYNAIALIVLSSVLLESYSNAQEIDSKPAGLSVLEPDDLQIELLPLDSNQTVDPGSLPFLEPKESSPSIESAPRGIEENQLPRLELERYGDFDFGEAETLSQSPRQLATPMPTEVAPQQILGVLGKPVDGWGFFIMKILPGTSAEKMKLEHGDVILAVNGIAAESSTSIAQALRKSGKCSNGWGFVVIDNVRARGKTSNSCHFAAKSARFQKIWFQLK